MIDCRTLTDTQGSSRGHMTDVRTKMRQRNILVSRHVIFRSKQKCRRIDMGEFVTLHDLDPSKFAGFRSKNAVRFVKRSLFTCLQDSAVLSATFECSARVCLCFMEQDVKRSGQRPVSTAQDHPPSLLTMQREKIEQRATLSMSVYASRLPTAPCSSVGNPYHKI